MSKTVGLPRYLKAQDETPVTWYPLHSACWRDEEDWDNLSCRWEREARETSQDADEDRLAGLIVATPTWPTSALSDEEIREAVMDASIRLDLPDSHPRSAQPPASLVMEGLNRYRSCQIVAARRTRESEVDELAPLAAHLARAHASESLRAASMRYVLGIRPSVCLTQHFAPLNRALKELFCDSGAWTYWLRHRFAQQGYYTGYEVPEHVYYPGCEYTIRVPYQGGGKQRVSLRRARLSGPRPWLETVYKSWQQTYARSAGSSSASRPGAPQPRITLHYPVPEGCHPDGKDRTYTEVQVSLALGHARSLGPQEKDIEEEFIEAGRRSLLRDGAGIRDVAHPFANNFPFFLYTSPDEKISSALQGCHPGTGYLAMSYPFYGVLLQLGSLLHSYIAGLLNNEDRWPRWEKCEDWCDAVAKRRPWTIPEAGRYWHRLAPLHNPGCPDPFTNPRGESSWKGKDGNYVLRVVGRADHNDDVAPPRTASIQNFPSLQDVLTDMIRQADPEGKRHKALVKARTNLTACLESHDPRVLMRFTTVGAHRYEEGTPWQHREVIRILNVHHWPTLAWNTIQHHLAQQPESREWSAKGFLESLDTYAHLGSTTRRSFSHVLNPQGTPPRPLWHEQPSGSKNEDAFPMVTPSAPAEALEEHIAEQLEG